MFDSDAEAGHWLSQFAKRHPHATTVELIRAVADAAREECEGPAVAWSRRVDTPRQEDGYEEDND